MLAANLALSSFPQGLSRSQFEMAGLSALDNARWTRPGLPSKRNGASTLSPVRPDVRRGETRESFCTFGAVQAALAEGVAICDRMQAFPSPAPPHARENMELDEDSDDAFFDARETFSVSGASSADDVSSTISLALPDMQAQIETLSHALDELRFEATHFISHDLRKNFLPRIIEVACPSKFQLMNPWGTYRSHHEYFLGTPESGGGLLTPAKPSQPGCFAGIGQTLSNLEERIGEISDMIQAILACEADNPDLLPPDGQGQRFPELLMQFSSAKTMLNACTGTFNADKDAILQDFALFGPPAEFNVRQAIRTVRSTPGTIRTESLVQDIWHAGGAAERMKFLEDRYYITDMQPSLQTA